MAELLTQYAKQAVGLAILAYAAWLYWPTVASYAAPVLSWFKRSPKVTTDATATTDDDADLAAFKRLRTRLAKCPDAVKALDAVWAHFWHTGGDS